MRRRRPAPAAGAPEEPPQPDGPPGDPDKPFQGDLGRAAAVTLALWAATALQQTLLWHQSLRHVLSPSAMFWGLMRQQHQPLLVALFVGTLSVLSMTASCALAALVLVYGVADLVAFRVGGQHLTLGMTERAADSRLVSTMWASFVDELDGTAALSLLAAALAVGRVSRCRGSRRSALLLLVLACANLPELVLQREWPGPVFASPLWALAQTAPPATAVRAPLEPPAGRSADALYEPLRDAVPSGPDARLEAFKARVPAGADVLFFTHEGVGRPDPAEYLGELVTAGDSVLFPSVYTSFPSTLRSFVPMMTGGFAGTQGDILGQAAARFTGESVVSALGGMGYERGFFGSGRLGFEGLDKFLQNLGYDEYFDFNSADEGWQSAHRLTTWGAADDATAARALRWARSVPAERPLLLQLFPCNTHHPYRLRAGGKSYPAAVREADAVLRTLVEGLAFRERPLLVVVNSDHGEAMGDVHPGNLLHKNYLYEENVRVFLALVLLGAPGDKLEPALSHRVLRHGDLLPTLQRLLGAAPQARTQHGQDALARDFRPASPYFLKTAGNLAIGMRDGRWKFVSTLTLPERRVELFDLSADPTEQRNLAGEPEHAAAIAHMDALVAMWYDRLHCDWLERLEGYAFLGAHADRCAADSAPMQLLAPGPSKLVFGYHRDGQIEAAPPGDAGVRLGRTRNFGIWTEWVPFRRDTDVRFRFTAPDGSPGPVFDFTVKKGWHTTRYRFRASVLAPGRWRLDILRAGHPEPLLGEWVEVLAS